MSDVSDLFRTSTEAPVVNGNAPSTQPIDDSLEMERELQRLQGELAAAKARIAAAQQRIAARDAEIQAALRTELQLAQNELAELNRQHEDDLAALREFTAAEVSRLLAEHPDPSRVSDVD